jgi:hypothetical protein
MTDADRHTPPTPSQPNSVGISWSMAAAVFRQVVSPGYLAAFVGFCASLGIILYLATAGTTAHRLSVSLIYFTMAFTGFGSLFLSYRLVSWIVSLFLGIAVDVGKEEAKSWVKKRHDGAKPDPVDPELAALYDRGGAGESRANAPPIAGKSTAD